MPKSKKVQKMDRRGKSGSWKKFTKEQRALLETMDKYTDAVINEDIDLLKELSKY